MRLPIDELITSTLVEDEHQASLRRYFGELTYCSAIPVMSQRRYPVTIKHDEILNVIPTFSPPRSFCWLYQHHPLCVLIAQSATKVGLCD